MPSPSLPPEETARPGTNSPVSLQNMPALPFYSDSEMTERIREFEWAGTPLGPIGEWPPELGNAVDIMLGAGEAISIYWGPRHILLYNDAWRVFIEDKHPAALGRPARELFPEIWDTIGPRFAHVLDGHGATFEREQKLSLERNGAIEDTWFDYSFNPIPMADGSIGGVFNIGMEVTERVNAREALRQSEAFHRLAAEAGEMGLWSVDLATGDAVLSPGMAELMGYDSDAHEAVPGRPDSEHWQQMVSRADWASSIHPNDLPILDQQMAASREDGSPFELEYRILYDGEQGREVRWLYGKGRVTRNGPEEGPHLRGVSVNVTRRRELEEALVSTSENVRREIGRELHDVLSSDLAALAMKADNLACQLRQTNAPSEDDSSSDDPLTHFGTALEDLADGIRSTAKQSRTLSHALMPVALQEEHLAAALQHLCDEQAEFGEPTPIFEGNREEPLPANKETAMHLYRIAREAITNAQRHAEATHIRVRLHREHEQLVLTIRDDGGGLSGPNDPQDGIGLQTMKHRAGLVGATLQLDSPKGGGTVVRCALPLSAAEHL